MVPAFDRHTGNKMKEKSNRLNLEFLKEMAGGDLGFVIDILKIFVEDAPLTLKNIETGLSNPDYESVKISVHKLKSSVKVLGVEKLAEFAQQLEDDAGKAQGGEEFKLRIKKFEKSVEELVKESTQQIKYLEKV